MLVGKTLPRLPHIWKRNMATFTRQIPATLQVTHNRTLGLEWTLELLQAKPLLLNVSTPRPREGQGHAHESESYSPTGSTGTWISPFPLLSSSTWHSVSHWKTSFYLSVYEQASVWQREFSVFVPTVTVSKNTYILWETVQRHNRDKV